MRGSRSARSVFAAAAAGDARAREVVAGEAAIVARALAAIVAVVDPELIVLGGGIGRAPGFAEEVARELARLSPVVPDVRRERARRGRRRRRLPRRRQRPAVGARPQLAPRLNGG